VYIVYMKRKAYLELIDWKNSFRRKPLLFRGARQVGKSWLVDQFGKHNFENYIKIDLEKSPELRSIFEIDLDPKRICRDLEIHISKKLNPENSLLFIDEIQSCPRAITSLRYFFEEYPELPVIAAGSLLDFALSSISFPVGRVQILDIFPMSFEEFVYARGNEQLALVLRGTPQRLSEPMHNKALAYVKEYFFVGGMPEVVKVFCETDSYLDAFSVQNEIIETYKLDFSKYIGRSDPACLREVWLNAARQIGCQIKYSKLSTNFSNPTISKSVGLLEQAQLIKRVPSVNPHGLPLGASASNKIFKAICVDIGIMQKLCGLAFQTEYNHQNLLDIYRGGLAEQFIGQELIAAGDNGLFYWTRKQNKGLAEIDYCYEPGDGSVIPIEVKSGFGGRLKSLHLFLQTFELTKEGVVFSQRPFEQSVEQNITYCPFYFAGSLLGKSAERQVWF